MAEEFVIQRFLLYDANLEKIIRTFNEIEHGITSMRG